MAEASPQRPAVSRIPRGAHGLTTDEVVAIQRGRIIAAFVDLVGERGYAETSVHAVCRSARVARRDFDRAFADLEAVYDAAYDVAKTLFMDRATTAYVNAGPDWEARVRAAIAAVLDTMAANPALTRVCVVESAAAGEIGYARVTRAVKDGFTVLAEAETGRPPVLGLEDVMTLVAGALFTRIYLYVLQGRTAELPELLDSLTYVTLLYFLGPRRAAAHLQSATSPPGDREQTQRHNDTAPRQETRPAFTRPDTVERRDDGSAPASVAAQSVNDGDDELLPGVRSPQDPSRQLPPGPHGMSRDQVLEIQRSRVIDALVHLLDESGYMNATVEAICNRAGVSTKTLYQLFPGGRGDVLVATVEIAREALFSKAAAAFAAAGPVWEQQVRAALEAVLQTLAAHAPMARVCIVELANAGAVGHALIVDAVQDATDLLQQLEPTLPGPVPVDQLVPVLIGGIYTRMYFHVLAGHTNELPELLNELTYFALVPFVGVERAARHSTLPPPNTTVPDKRR